MARFSNLDDVSRFVRHNDRAELLQRVNGGSLTGEASRSWAKAWLARDFASTSDFLPLEEQIGAERSALAAEQHAFGTTARRGTTICGVFLALVIATSVVLILRALWRA